VTKNLNYTMKEEIASLKLTEANQNLLRKCPCDGDELFCVYRSVDDINGVGGSGSKSCRFCDS